MAATNQNIKDFFALTGSNPPVTNDQLTDLADWLSSVTGEATPNADSVVDYIYKTFAEQVRAHKRRTTATDW